MFYCVDFLGCEDAVWLLLVVQVALIPLHVTLCIQAAEARYLWV